MIFPPPLPLPVFCCGSSSEEGRRQVAKTLSGAEEARGMGREGGSLLPPPHPPSFFLLHVLVSLSPLFLSLSLSLFFSSRFPSIFSANFLSPHRCGVKMCVASSRLVRKIKLKKHLSVRSSRGFALNTYLHAGYTTHNTSSSLLLCLFFFSSVSNILPHLTPPPPPPLR